MNFDKINTFLFVLVSTFGREQNQISLNIYLYSKRM